MPPRVSLIHREGSVSVPVDYTLEPGEAFEFASVRAKVNGAAAAATFVMVLEALSQDGKIITQAPIDQEFAVGDTGALTWAPFLRRQAAAAPAGTSELPGFHAHKESTLTVPSANNQRINWDEWTIDGGTTYFQEGALSAGDLTEVQLMLAGWYAIECWASWDTEPATGFAGIAAVDDDTDIAEPRKVQGVTYPVNMSSAPAIAFQQVRYYPADFTQTQTLAFVNRIEFWIVQNSGVDRTLNEAYANIVYLGARLT